MESKNKAIKLLTIVNVLPVLAIIMSFVVTINSNLRAALLLLGLVVVIFNLVFIPKKIGVKNLVGGLGIAFSVAYISLIAYIVYGMSFI